MLAAPPPRPVRAFPLDAFYVRLVSILESPNRISRAHLVEIRLRRLSTSTFNSSRILRSSFARLMRPASLSLGESCRHRSCPKRGSFPASYTSRTRASSVEERCFRTRTFQTRAPPSSFRMVPRDFSVANDRACISENSITRAPTPGLFRPEPVLTREVSFWLGHVRPATRPARGCGHGLRPRGRRNSYISASMECRRFVCERVQGVPYKPQRYAKYSNILPRPITSHH